MTPAYYRERQNSVRIYADIFRNSRKPNCWKDLKHVKKWEQASKKSYKKLKASKKN